MRPDSQSLKVGKSQKQFFWNSIAQKGTKIFEGYGKNLSKKILFLFWALEFQQK